MYSLVKFALAIQSDKLVVVAIVVPLVVVQFGLALYTLTRLAHCGYVNKKYALYNVFTVLVFFVGPIATLILTKNDYLKSRQNLKNTSFVGLHNKDNRNLDLNEDTCDNLEDK